MIQDLISSMSAKEKSEFTQFLKNRSKRNVGRNIALFQHLNTGTETELKQKIGSNAYNVLKMRLTDTLLAYLSGKVFENELTTEALIIRQLVLARKMIQLEKIKTGKKILLKIETTAHSIQHFSLLNEIYHSMIEISHHEDTSVQASLIEKLESNTAHFLQQERLNLVTAQVKKAVERSEQGKERMNLHQLIEHNFQKFGISPERGYGLKSLYQIASVLDYAGAQSRNYQRIDLFLSEKLASISEEERNNERNHLYHIDLLYIVANIHFRKREFEQSLHHLDLMQLQLFRFERKFHDERIAKYTLLYALNLNFMGNSGAALELIQQTTLSKETLEGLQIKLSEIMMLAQQERFKEANAGMRDLYKSDTYYKRIAGLEWVINRRFIEIILQIELGNIDFAISRIESVTRQHKDFLNASENAQAKPFLLVIKRYLNHPASITSEAFQAYLEKTIPWNLSSEQDIFFISFYAWLKSKMTRQSIYKQTLDLVRSK